MCMHRLLVILFLVLIAQPSLGTTKVCQMYTILISLDDEKHTEESIARVVEKNNKMEFVLSFHAIWYNRGSQIELCIPQNLDLKYDALATDENWLTVNGYYEKNT